MPAAIAAVVATLGVVLLGSAVAYQAINRAKAMAQAEAQAAQATAPAAANAQPAEAGAARGPDAKRYTRDEFRKLVWGKQPAEILALIGKPERTTPYRDDGRRVTEETWDYRSLTTDPISGATDARVTLTFGQSNPVSVRDVRFD